ncbi:MAG TPA: hypothetical protein VKY44_09450 [Flavobacterium sp.]|nr:hypothetical protein [Flavobacterium sp.]
MNFRIIYPKGLRLSLKDKTFKEAMELVWLSDIATNSEPLKMIFTNTGKMLYMDKNAHHAYLRGELTMPELIELTEIDELYRNKTDVISNERIRVEAGSLWKLRQQTLMLIDDDRQLTHKLNLDIFEISEPNM